MLQSNGFFVSTEKKVYISIIYLMKYVYMNQESNASSVHIKYDRPSVLCTKLTNILEAS